MNIQVKVKSINDLIELYDEGKNWQQSFFEALGSFMSGCDYMIIDDDNNSFMAMYCDNVKEIEKHEL